MKYLPLFLAALALSSANSAFSQQKGIEGEVAPPLRADNWINLPEGEAGLIVEELTPGIDLKKYRGKVVVMKFFQAWCEACEKRSFPKLKKLVDHYEGNEQIQFFVVQTVFEGLADNTASKLQPTAEKHGLESVPFGHCVKLANIPNVNIDYKTGGTPWWVVVNKDGIVEFNGHYIDLEKAIANLDELIAASPSTTAAE